MAKNLKLDIVAEGVERLEQKQALHDMGCMTVQGFYLSRPLQLNQLEQYLNLCQTQ